MRMHPLRVLFERLLLLYSTPGLSRLCSLLLFQSPVYLGSILLSLHTPPPRHTASHSLCPLLRVCACSCVSGMWHCACQVGRSAVHIRVLRVAGDVRLVLHAEPHPRRHLGGVRQSRRGHGRPGAASGHSRAERYILSVAFTPQDPLSHLVCFPRFRSFPAFASVCPPHGRFPTRFHLVSRIRFCHPVECLPLSLPLLCRVH